MRLVDDHKVPPSRVRVDRFPKLWVRRSEVKGHDPQGMLARFECMLADGVRRYATKLPTEEPRDVLLPFPHQVGRTHDQGPVHDTEAARLGEVQPSHDGLAGTWFVGEQKT